MTPERWREVKKLLDTVLSTPEEAREPLLEEACRSDPSLRKEVESLLASEGERDASLDAYDAEPFDPQVDMDLVVPSTAFQLCPKCRTENSLDSNFCKHCGHRFARTGTLPAGALEEEPPAPSSTPTLQTGLLVNERYRLGKPLGQGGMGVVYRATDVQTGKEVAIKFLKLSTEQSREAFKRFSREIRITKKLDHANLVRLLAAGRFESTDYLVMEYVSGETLQDRIRRFNVSEVRPILSIVIQVCDALDAAHRAGIIHRDVKPSNVLLDEDGRVKICDFGLAFNEGLDFTRITQTGDAMGTPEYMAPEQIEGKRVDVRADIYSVGVLMYEAFTGQRPFQGGTAASVAMQHLKSPPAPPSRANPTLPAHIERAILKCLEKNPEKRFESMVDLRRALIRGVNRRVREAHKTTGDFIITGEGESGYELILERREMFPDWDEFTALSFRDGFYQLKDVVRITHPTHPFRITFVPWPDATAFRRVVDYEAERGGAFSRLKKFLR